VRCALRSTRSSCYNFSLLMVVPTALT